MGIIFRTKEACDVFNKAWGKPTQSFDVGKPSPLPPTTPLAVVIAQAQAAGSPQIDCVGPDKKALDATKEVCDAFTKNWGKTTPSFNPGVTTGVGIQSAIPAKSSTGSSTGASN